MIVDQFKQSENLDVEDSFNDAACLTKLKVEVAEILKKHELLNRNTSTNPTSDISSCSYRIRFPSAPEFQGVVQSMQDTRHQQPIIDL